MYFLRRGAPTGRADWTLATDPHVESVAWWPLRASAVRGAVGHGVGAAPLGWAPSVLWGISGAGAGGADLPAAVQQIVKRPAGHYRADTPLRGVVER